MQPDLITVFRYKMSLDSVGVKLSLLRPDSSFILLFINRIVFVSTQTAAVTSHLYSNTPELSLDILKIRDESEKKDGLEATISI